MKIALLTIWHCGNYGAELQTYATVRKLRELGHQIEVIDFRLEEPIQRTSLYGRISDFLHDCAPVSIKFRCFWSKYITATKHYRSLEELRKDPPNADLYLVGSDQVWNLQITKAKAPAFFLDFTPEGAELASYASSFGTDKWLGDAEITMVAKRQLHRFKKISCRELQGCTILKDVFHVDSEHVLDPSLLHVSYPELTGKIKQRNTLAYYQLSENEALRSFAQQKAQEMGLQFVDVNQYSQLTPTFTWNRRSVGQWIKTLAESKFVITHSFHGLAICLLYKRPFVVIYDQGNRVSRLASMLKMVGLEDRLFYSIKDASESIVWNKPIDFPKVEDSLGKFREISINYLKSITKG